MPGLKERAKTLVELMEGARFIVADRPLALDDKAAALLTPEARHLLGDLSVDLDAVEPWTAEATEQAIRAFAERKGVKLGAVAQPLRAALTGRDHLAADFRRAGGAREEREPRPAARSGPLPVAHYSP